jgi:lauroyl/myristoyl acyltransferase
VDDASTSEAIRLTTRDYNAAIERLVLRRPEQWYWVHRRWKKVDVPARRRKLREASA